MICCIYVDLDVVDLKPEAIIPNLGINLRLEGQISLPDKLHVHQVLSMSLASNRNSIISGSLPWCSSQAQTRDSPMLCYFLIQYKTRALPIYSCDTHCRVFVSGHDAKLVVLRE